MRAEALTRRRALRRSAAAVLVLLAACGQLPQEPAPTAPASPPATGPAPAATPPAAPQAPAIAAPPPPAPSKTMVQTGRVSFYATSFTGKKTASGDTFDPEALTMAHRSLPFGTRVRVTNLRNQRSVEVVVNDRGPMIEGRIADLSPAAARAIGLTDGVANARLEVLSLPD